MLYINIKKRILILISSICICLLSLFSAVNSTVQAKPYEALLGSLLGPQDYIVSGISLGTEFDAVKKSLGTPDEEIINGDYHALRYGGTTYSNFKDRHTQVSDISVTKRDATTGRGIVIGDSLGRVYERYGFPDEAHKDYAFYGRYYSRTSHYQGIFFYVNPQNIITKIWITAG